MNQKGVSLIKGDYMLNEISVQTTAVIKELLAMANLKPGDILVVGCSSSEIQSHKIGSFSNAEIGAAVFEAIYKEVRAHHLYIAAQCCEHLNRALIIEAEAALRYGYDRVNVVPQLKAGGSFAAAAYEHLSDPVAVEAIKAKAGIDIGDTLIGMHLAPVAVPVRVKQSQIGSAHVVCARTRYKFIGGERAVYDKTLS